jgi:glutathione synthase/RimK-type ligase-like ATP-grasp enzyme
MLTVHLLYEQTPQSAAWNAPYVAEFERRGWTCQPWDLRCLDLDLDSPPAPGVVLNRCSPSASWRDAPQAFAVTLLLLRWFDHHGLAIVSGEKAMHLEMSKAWQHLQCRRHGVPAARTAACTAAQRAALAQRSQRWGPCLLKPDCGGSGNGVTLRASLDGGAGLWVVQELAGGEMRRLEMVAGQLLYALKVRTVPGLFDNCPADHCDLPSGKFTPDLAFPSTDEETELVRRLQRLLRACEVDVAGVEIMRDGSGGGWKVIDINCVNTNYNGAAERQAGVRGVARVADLLAQRLPA